MDSPLKSFFRQERDRFFAPGPFFSKRVLQRLKNVSSVGSEADYAIWDLAAGLVRPIFALALIVFLGILAVDFFIPRMPERGMVEAFLDVDQDPGESLLYSDAELPNREELFVEMMGLGE